MYKFEEMSPKEFERFAKDIMEREFNMQFRTFAEGRDGGRDIEALSDSSFVGQAKHFKRSTYSSLKSILLKEKQKLYNSNIKRYIIITSMSLTPGNLNEIYQIFKEFMESKNDIYDGERLNDILEKESNYDIVEKNYKLWIKSSEVLKNILLNKSTNMDTKNLIYEFESKKNIVVEIDIYKKILTLLENKNVLLLYGEKGIGKTTLATMASMYYHEKGYNIRYASNNSIKDLKMSLSEDDTVEEVILLDDFLGKEYQKIERNIFSELKVLLNIVLRNPKKILILVSRASVLREFLSLNEDFEFILEEQNIPQYLVDKKKLSREDKEKIWDSYIYANINSDEKYNELVECHDVEDIIEHINFTPGIMKYVTIKKILLKKSIRDYISYVLESLNNPEKIWKEEFRNLNKEDRIFLMTMFTLTDKYVKENILKDAFTKRLRSEKNYDSTKNIYNECLNRFLEWVVIKNEDVIILVNESINDFLLNYFKELDEFDEMIKSAISINQINKLYSINKQKSLKMIEERFLNKSFFDLNDLSDYEILYYISELKLEDESLSEKIYSIFWERTCFGSNKERNADIIMRFIGDERVYNFYKLNALVIDITRERTLAIYYDYLGIRELVKITKMHEKIILEEPRKGTHELLLSINCIDEIDKSISWEIECEIVQRLNLIIIEMEYELRFNTDKEMIRIIMEKLIILIRKFYKELSEEFEDNQFLGKNLKISEKTILSELSIG